MTPQRTVALALVGVALAAPVRAQESVFNLPAFGLPASGETMRARGQGGAGIGLPGDAFSLENPAMLARFESAGFYLTLLGQQTHVEDPLEEGDFDDVAFPMGQAVVPAFDGVIGVGFHEFVDFDGALESTVAFEEDTLPVTLDSNGGLFVLAPAVGWPVGRRTAIGASLDVYLGSREVVRSVAVENLAGTTITTSDSLDRDFSGVGLTLGIEQGIGRDARVGISYRLRPHAASEITDSTGDALVGRETDFDLPDELLVGATARVTGALRASFVFRSSGWGGFDGGSLEEGDLEDVVEIGGGIEFEPADPVAVLFGPGAPLRAGLRWRRLPIRVEDTEVGEWALTFGYSRGFGPRSLIDVVLEYGRRGSLDDNGLTERHWRLGVGIGLFEQWRRAR